MARWGIKPDAVIGHSIGEIAAAYVAGALSLPEAIDVVYHRSRLQERTRLQGGMAAVGLPMEAAESYLSRFNGKLEVAAINGPELVTVAGPRPLIEQFVAEIGRDEQHFLCQLLRVDYGFHSSQMDPFVPELRDSLAKLRSKPLHLPMFSTVTGAAVTELGLDADYWCRNMRQPVLFRQAVDQAINADIDTFIELGAHPSLGAAVRACLADRGREGITIATLHREREDVDAIATAVASLHVHGFPIDWRAIVSRSWNFIELPGYQFDKTVYWSESDESRSARLKGPAHPLLGYHLGPPLTCGGSSSTRRRRIIFRTTGSTVPWFFPPPVMSSSCLRRRVKCMAPVPMSSTPCVFTKRYFCPTNSRPCWKRASTKRAGQS